MCVRLVLMLGLLPCFFGYSVVPPRLGHLRRSPAVIRMMAEDTIDDAALDALVRKEIEAAFAGMEEKFASGDDDAALKIMQDESKTVLNNVFAKLEADGQLLSSNLASRIEDLAADRSTELLAKYEDEIKSISSNLNAERANIRSEMEQVSTARRLLSSLPHLSSTPSRTPLSQFLSSPLTAPLLSWNRSTESSRSFRPVAVAASTATRLWAARPS